jgi:hypothetical protein
MMHIRDFTFYLHHFITSNCSILIRFLYHFIVTENDNCVTHLFVVYLAIGPYFLPKRIVQRV